MAGGMLAICMLMSGSSAVADRTLAPISLEPIDSEVSEDIRCLAMNIYHEARGESLLGQEAVASVTMNRVRNPRYPDSVCEVVWQPKQFSWTRTHKKFHAIQDRDAWNKALVVARATFTGYELSRVGQATHYHAVHVQPYWADDGILVARIGRHLFYIVDTPA